MNGDRRERQFHQTASAALLALGLILAVSPAGPWITAVACLPLLAGSLTARLSLTRACYRYFLAPLSSGPAAWEDQTPYLRADALTGTLALAGTVLVLGGIPPVGWGLVGVSALCLGLDAAVNTNPLRWLAGRIHPR